MAGRVPGRSRRRHERGRHPDRFRAGPAGAGPSSASASGRAESPPSTPASGTTTREQTVESAPQAAVSRRSSRASTTTTTPGTIRHDVVKDSVTIGRGGIAYPVDIRIASSRRRVARARAHPPGSADRPLLPDRSELARHDAERPPRAARATTSVDGAKRENGVETPLPDTARIGLADMVFLDFRKVRLMALLLWARFVLLAALAALVARLRVDRPTSRDTAK